MRTIDEDEASCLPAALDRLLMRKYMHDAGYVIKCFNYHTFDDNEICSLMELEQFIAAIISLYAADLHYTESMSESNEEWAGQCTILTGIEFLFLYDLELAVNSYGNENDKKKMHMLIRGLSDSFEGSGLEAVWGVDNALIDYSHRPYMLMIAHSEWGFRLSIALLNFMESFTEIIEFYQEIIGRLPFREEHMSYVPSNDNIEGRKSTSY